jgi:serine/threonine protein kinase
VHLDRVDLGGRRIIKKTMVGHYRIVEKIGAGGMGEVYLAEDTQLDRKVALKFLPPHLCQDDDCRARFKREAQAAAKLSHPNIIHVYEVSEYQGRPFFAMEHVEGRSLREFSSGKDLSIDQILELAIQVCEGLNEAHEKGVTHRDIKPSNIIVDSHGRAKIVDFGLASVVGKDQLTRTGSTLGTIGYMSPEQIEGKETDARSDLFSLGVVLYELITKQNPFKRETEAATLKAVCDDTPHPVARYRADVPDGMQAIIDKALEKDVKTRYQHADGMLSDLMRIKRSLDSGQSRLSVSSQADRSSRVWWIGGAVIVVAVAIALIDIKPWRSLTVSDAPERTMLAVLPFENLGDPEDEYFADGMTEEITTRLAKIGRIGVIARSSAYKYKNTEKDIKDIARELGVNFILEGTIRWTKADDTGRVRITPQLIDVSNNTYLWTENYELPLSNVFSVQIEISSQITSALNVTLLPKERNALEDIPTSNMAAYDAYLRALDIVGNVLWSADLRPMFERLLQSAIELDPDFAHAYCVLSRYYTWLYHSGDDRTEECLSKARKAAEKALVLQPDLPEAHVAMGYFYYQGLRDYARALQELSTVEDDHPNNAAAMGASGYIFRRLGNFEAAIKKLEQAFTIDPTNPGLASEIGYTHLLIREYKEAERWLDLAISINSTWLQAHSNKVQLFRLWDGRLKDAGELLDDIPIPEDIILFYEKFDQKVLERDYQTAIDMLDSCPYETTWVLPQPLSFLRAFIYYFSGKKEMARIWFDSARVTIEKRLEEKSDSYTDLANLGAAYAGLGLKEAAVREGKLAVTLCPISKDALDGADYLINLVGIYIQVGEYDAAIDQLDYLLSIPSELSVYRLSYDPIYDPLRDHPRFQALIKKYDTAK